MSNAINTLGILKFNGI